MNCRLLPLLTACVGLQSSLSLAGEDMSVCEISSRFSCFADGCDKFDVPLKVTIDWKRRLYMRCDAKECRNFDVLMEQPTLQIIYFSANNKTIQAQMLSNGKQFQETLTIGWNPVISFGSCK